MPYQVHSLPLTEEVLTKVLAKYNARLNAHIGKPTFLTQVDDVELSVLLRIGAAVLDNSRK